jgi:hypothetical protein
MASFHASVSRIVHWSLDMRASSPSLQCSARIEAARVPAEDESHIGSTDEESSLRMTPRDVRALS